MEWIIKIQFLLIHINLSDFFYNSIKWSRHAVLAQINVTAIAQLFVFILFEIWIPLTTISLTKITQPQTLPC